ncbi:MAG TPA: hypothetical protein VHI71_09705 [Actinomycetota bacterium]|nr:hypothetical protein [Actinomycetota bacterium]
MPAPKPAKLAADRRAPRCRACGETIEVPPGWSHGPAVRRHYWARHRDVMTRTPRGPRKAAASAPAGEAAS